MHPASSSVCSVQVKVQQNEVFQALLDEFPTITRPPTAITPIKHKVTHHIITKGPTDCARKTENSQSGSQHHATPRRHLSLIKQLVKSTSHGAQ